MQYLIIQDDQELLSGSEANIRAVFDHLTGRTMSGQLYLMYLKKASVTLGVEIEPTRLEIRSETKCQS